MSDYKYDFGSKFIETKGQPIKYQDKELIMVERIQVEKNTELTITIESTNSNYIQGIGISEEVEIFGQKTKRPVIWETISIPPEERKNIKSKLPYSFIIKAIKKGTVTIYNMCLYNGRQEWWHHGSCMYKKQEKGIIRLFCNDFEPDDDFDDIIFSIKL